MNRLSLRSVHEAAKMFKFAPSKGDKIMRRTSLLALSLTLAGLAVQSARAGLVTNGDFETGDFAGWSVSDSSVLIDSGSGFVADGNFDAAFTGSGVLSQTLLTSPGQSYILSFNLVDEAASASDTFHVTFGSYSTDISGGDASVFTSEVLSVPGVDIPVNAILSFQATSNALAWHLDDVSVALPTIPEPPIGMILAGAVLMVVSLRFRARMIDG
jgi:hypothetical protein